MSDTTHEAPDRIWIWGWRADSVWQEQTWQHEDEPMSTMEYVRFDLMETAEQQGYANAMEAERKLHEDRIVALTAERDRLRKELEAIADDCEAEYPPSHGAIKYAVRMALKGE